MIAAAAGLAAVMTWPLISDPGHLARPDTSDGQFSIWNVAWVARAVVRDPAHLFDANIFYPHRGTLAYSESNLGAGLLAVPAYWLSGNPILAHNVVVLLSFILSGVGMYYLARYHTGSPPASAVAGILFAFCPYTLAHTAHIQLLMTAGLPFSLLCFHRLVDRPGPVRSALLGVTLTATALSCGYYGVFAALLVACGSAFYLLSRRSWSHVDYFVGLAVAAGIALALVWPVLRPYLQLGGLGKPFRELKDTIEFSANWSAYRAAAGLGDRWMLQFARDRTEVLFPGFVTLALATTCGLAVFRPAAAGGPDTARGAAGARESETVWFYAVSSGFALWLSFGPSAGLYRVFYRYVPSFTLLRAPARFGLVVTLSLVVLGAVGLAALLRGRRHAALIAGAVGLLALVELSAMPLPFLVVPPPSFVYRLLAQSPPGAVIELPFFYREEDYHQHGQYVLNSTVHWKPLLNGFSDFYPADFRAMGVPVSSFPTLEAFGILRQHRARYVVFHLNGYDHVNRPRVLQRIDLFRDSLRPMASDGDIRLYEIVAWPAREPH